MRRLLTSCTLLLALGCARKETPPTTSPPPAPPPQTQPQQPPGPSAAEAQRLQAEVAKLQGQTGQLQAQLAAEKAERDKDRAEAKVQDFLDRLRTRTVSVGMTGELTANIGFKVRYDLGNGGAMVSPPDDPALFLVLNTTKKIVPGETVHLAGTWRIRNSREHKGITYYGIQRVTPKQ